MVPADKSQQMSDWSARPLTARQQCYAALDAYVLPQLYDALRQRLGPDTMQQLVHQHTKTYSRVSASSKPSAHCTRGLDDQLDAP
jgi:ribonuclease D